MNKWKVFGLAIATWLVFALIAKMYSGAIRIDLLSASSTVWSWSSLIMGIVMKAKAQRWAEFGYGLAAFVVCLFPLVGIIAGIAYFARCYYKMEQLAIVNRNQAG
ncbi:hypothetical protein [Acetonema longum]|uniref:hypothetical protein n=1 Tax=Acetonema longum TaxID=2374 RepID=UPI0011122E00|nr:hypothetical protein [Acetonema longum]